MKPLVPLLLCTNTAWAECNPPEVTFLACDFANGKAVELCTDGNFARYVFGTPGETPELALTLAFQEGAEMVPWNGVGRTIWEAIRLTNNYVTYEVYGGFDKQEMVEWDAETEASPVFGGIYITDLDGTQLAHLRCVPGTIDWGF